MIRFTRFNKVLLFLNYLSILLVSASEVGDSHQSHQANPIVKREVPDYDGEWDMSAKQTAIMCEAIKIKDYDGSYPVPEPKRDSYLRDGVCWKNAWVPCEDAKEDDSRLGPSGAMSRRHKPCGYFEMVKTANEECD